MKHLGLVLLWHQHQHRRRSYSAAGTGSPAWSRRRRSQEGRLRLAFLAMLQGCSLRAAQAMAEAKDEHDGPELAPSEPSTGVEREKEKELKNTSTAEALLWAIPLWRAMLRCRFALVELSIFRFSFSSCGHAYERSMPVDCNCYTPSKALRCSVA